VKKSEKPSNVDASNSRGIIIGDFASMINHYHLHNQEPLLADTLAGLADQLAFAVGRQWSHEATRQQLNDPYALPVEWLGVEHDLVTPWPTLVKLATEGPGWPRQSTNSWAKGPVDLSGGGNNLMEVLDRIPTGRLIVFGEAGAGKTVLLIRLVLDLLTRRAPGDPVPVMLPLASWDPSAESLYRWMESRLATEIQALAGRWSSNRRVTKLQALLESGLVLPVLDGLDEMPEQMISVAIGQINAALLPGQRLVISCRSPQSRSLDQGADKNEFRFAGAASIEISPLDPSIVSDYLQESAGGKESATRWRAVNSALKSKPPLRPIGEAMTTPLAASLAREIYNPKPGRATDSDARHPDELLDTGVLPTRLAIENHLLDGLIPSAYRPKTRASTNINWNEQQAIKWLSFLARDLEYRQGGTTDLGWWQLAEAIPRPVIGLVVGLTAGLVGGLTIPWRGWGIGVLVGVLAALAMSALVKPRERSLARGLAGGVLGAEAASSIGLIILGTGVRDTYLASFLAVAITVGVCVASIGVFRVGVVGGFLGQAVIIIFERTQLLQPIRFPIGSPPAYLLNGIAVGTVAGLSGVAFGTRSPARGLRWSKLGFATGVLAGAIFGLVIWAVVRGGTGVAFGGLAVVAGGLAGGLYEAAKPVDLAQANSPPAVLARDRATFLSSLGLALLLGALVGVATALSPRDPQNGQYFGATYGAGIGVATFVGVGLGLAFHQALWGQLLLFRVCSALSGGLPINLMGFLKDAHSRRGVLRQVGAVYQFRHVELQRRLAGRPGPESWPRNLWTRRASTPQRSMASKGPD
jgi:GTPase SAR1 family protein